MLKSEELLVFIFYEDLKFTLVYHDLAFLSRRKNISDLIGRMRFSLSFCPYFYYEERRAFQSRGVEIIVPRKNSAAEKPMETTVESSGRIPSK